MKKVKKVSARIDARLKDEFVETLEGIGFDCTAAVRSFALQIARKKAMPFELGGTSGSSLAARRWWRR